MSKPSSEDGKETDLAWVDVRGNTKKPNYLKRLSQLRDNLYSQENQNFTSALDRLRRRGAVKEVSPPSNIDKMHNHRKLHGSTRNRALPVYEHAAVQRKQRYQPHLVSLQGQPPPDPNNKPLHPTIIERLRAIGKFDGYYVTSPVKPQTTVSSTRPSTSKSVSLKKNSEVPPKSGRYQQRKGGYATFPLQRSPLQLDCGKVHDNVRSTFRLRRINTTGFLKISKSLETADAVPVQNVYSVTSNYAGRTTTPGSSNLDSSLRISPFKRKTSSFSLTPRSLYNKTLDFNSSSDPDRLNLRRNNTTASTPLNGDAPDGTTVVSETITPINHTESDQIPGKETQVIRRHIVVDMPAIVFKSSTPMLDDDSDEEPSSRKESLSRTYRQSEVRNRELKCLLEDVQEINKVNKELLT